MKHIIFYIAIFQLLSSCASEAITEDNASNVQTEQQENIVVEENAQTIDLSDLHLPNDPFVFQDIAEILVTAKINNQEYQIFSSSDPLAFEKMSKVMSTKTKADPGCLFLGMITFTFKDGTEKYVEFNCHRDCHYATYFQDGEFVIRELTQEGVEYLNDLLTNPS